MPGHLRVQRWLLHRYHPCGTVRRAPCCRCHSSNSDVAWLDQASSPVRQDYDAVITLAGASSRVCQLLLSSISKHAFGAILAEMVIAGGLTPDGGLPEWVNRRLDAAADIQVHQGECCQAWYFHKGTPMGIACSLGMVMDDLPAGTSCGRWSVSITMPGRRHAPQTRCAGLQRPCHSRGHSLRKIPPRQGAHVLPGACSKLQATSALCPAHLLRREYMHTEGSGKFQHPEGGFLLRHGRVCDPHATTYTPGFLSKPNPGFFADQQLDLNALPSAVRRRNGFFALTIHAIPAAWRCFTAPLALVTWSQSISA